MSLITNGPIITVKQLAEQLRVERLVLLDATVPMVGQKNAPHSDTKLRISGARFFDIKKEFVDNDSPLPNTVPAPEQFERNAQKLGINKDSLIVVYDRHGIYSAPRAWWLFKLMGHEKVFVLDGGLPAWVESGLPVSSTELISYDLSVGNFKSRFERIRIKNREQVLNNMSSSAAVVYDARSAGRFHGTTPEPRVGLRSGHIPNSSSLPWSSIINDGHLISKKELDICFNNDTKQPVINYCGSGMTACILALAQEFVGIKNISVYDGSWTEWGQW